MEINYYAIVVAAILAMVLGAIWYGPLFGKKWMEIVGMDASDKKAMEKMKKESGKLYGITLLLTLFQVLVLSHLIADTTSATGLERALWIWAAFVIPTLFGASMWTMEKPKLKKARFLIQGGYQLVLFVMFGLILQYWI